MTAVPTIPSLPAGHIVTLADMQALASAASFLLTKPFSLVIDETGGQAIGTTGLVVQYTNALIDPDGMWSVSQKGRVTVITPGWYKLRYATNCGTGGGTYTTWVTITTGPNNPAGAGVTVAPRWGGYSDVQPTSSPGWAGGSGVLPVLMYNGDYCQLKVQAAVTGTSTGITAPGAATLGGSYASLEFVSA